MRHTEKSCRWLFDEIECTTLAPLPSEPFEHAEWKRQGFIPIIPSRSEKKIFYSVPHWLTVNQIYVQAIDNRGARVRSG
ncbi:hypothetical protein GGQ85_002911 [Nitrobacter vulgaris]|uniref:hypothetical protein n=1 Tax=Nitrobacter vulgaris TaxID=29421 RepID=UPI0028624209|nr:hypothetical protein [Nitrobacter vulgaris]